MPGAAPHDPNAFHEHVVRGRRKAAPPPFDGTFFRDAYPDPNIFDTAEALVRAHHDDVRQLTDEALANERTRAYLRRAYDPQPPSRWLRERIVRLDSEWARRHPPRRRS